MRKSKIDHLSERLCADAAPKQRRSRGSSGCHGSKAHNRTELRALEAFLEMHCRDPIHIQDTNRPAGPTDVSTRKRPAYSSCPKLSRRQRVASDAALQFGRRDELFQAVFPALPQARNLPSLTK